MNAFSACLNIDVADVTKAVCGLLRKQTNKDFLKTASLIRRNYEKKKKK